MKPSDQQRLRVLLLAALALTAFAANSLLCREALGSGAIDAASFSAIRLLCGAVTLLAAARLAGGGAVRERGNWGSAAALFLYVIFFSFAYLTLPAGTGALILFGAVQSTMILTGLRSGERPRPAEWLGLLVAGAGLACLVLPGVSAPSPLGALLMAVAGVAWGAYSLRGRGTSDPLAVTTGNFVRSLPFVLLVTLATLPQLSVTPRGALLAVLSGSLASGAGYVVWYGVVRRMTAILAATVQLTVPVLTAAGGVLFLGERVTLRLGLSAAAILGGVGLALLCRLRRIQQA